MKKIIIALLLLSSSAVIGQDTTIKVTVPYSFEVTRTVSGTRTLKVTLPLPKKDTVYIHDTIFVNTCPPQDVPLSWKEYHGTFQSFIDSAVSSGREAIIDTSVTPMAPVQVTGSIVLRGGPGVVITNINRSLFVLHPSATQVFTDLRIVQTQATAIAFERVISTGTTFYDSLHNVEVLGGSDAYGSSRGGIEGKPAITAMRNCIFKVLSIGVSVFSQDGNNRELHLRNVQIKTDTTHNIYVHPSVSLWYDSVASLGAGKLMQHQYSGSGNGGYNTAKYSVFKRIYTNGKMFEMTSIKDGYVRIDSSVIAPYVTMGIPPAKVFATNSKFVNNGNGILLSGILDRCTGGAWPIMGDTLNLIGCDLEELSFRNGGTVIAKGSTIKYTMVADRGYNFNGIIVDSEIKSLQDGRNGNGVLNLINTPRPAPYFGQPYRPEIINELNKNK